MYVTCLKKHSYVYIDIYDSTIDIIYIKISYMKNTTKSQHSQSYTTNMYVYRYVCIHER